MDFQAAFAVASACHMIINDKAVLLSLDIGCRLITCDRAMAAVRSQSNCHDWYKAIPSCKLKTVPVGYYPLAHI